MGSEHQVDESRDGLGKTIWQAVERITQLEEAVRVLAISGDNRSLVAAITAACKEVGGNG